MPAPQVSRPSRPEGSRSRSRALLTAVLATVLSLPLVALGAGPGAADHTDLPARVTLMGSLMSELGCGGDWDEGCAATDMTRVGETTTFALTKAVPAGTYAFKVRLNGSWSPGTVRAKRPGRCMMPCRCCVWRRRS